MLLCFEKSKWVVVAMVAVLETGGACVLLEPSHPMNHLESILDDIEAKVLLASSTQSRLLRDKVENVIEVTVAFLKGISSGAQSLENLPAVRSDNTAIGLFNSGSTRRPKGIVQQHSKASTNAQTFGITAGSRVLQWAAYAFDMSVIDMLMALVGGECICIPSEHDRMNNFSHAIGSMNMDCAALTPSIANALRAEDLPSLKTVVFGREVVSKENGESWTKRVYLINAYGPCDSSVCVAGDAKLGQPSNNGRAVGSVAWIVDEACHERLVPIGCIGEILIEGPLVARGYLNDPMKTAKSFIEDPPWLVQRQGDAFPGRKGRLYKSEDLGRYNADGSIYNFLDGKTCGRKFVATVLKLEMLDPTYSNYFLQR